MFKVINVNTGEVMRDIVISGDGRIFEDYICMECGKDMEDTADIVIEMDTGERFTL